MKHITRCLPLDGSDNVQHASRFDESAPHIRDGTELVRGNIGAPRLHQQLSFSEMKSQIIDRFDCGRACALVSRARTRPYGSRRS